jgi:hypothetical protein
MKKEKITIYYATNQKEEIARIQAENNLPTGYNINGEIECQLNKDDIERLDKEIRKGLIQIRRK